MASFTAPGRMFGWAFTLLGLIVFLSGLILFLASFLIALVIA